MELQFAKSGTRLIATFNCAAEPGTLRGGGVGWYEVKEIDWRLGWHLRSQVSITVTGDSYGGGWHGRCDLAPTVLGGDIVQLTFPIPDFIRPFKKSGWGGADGGPITIRSVHYHCQAQVRARDPGDGSYLERAEDGLRFCGPGGRLWGVVKDSLSPSEAELFLRNLLQRSQDR
jgi:hypothetical protein